MRFAVREGELMEDKIKITRLALGVRYHPQYKIKDSMGFIVDDVLRKRDTPFGPDFFPYSEAGAHFQRLTNLSKEPGEFRRLTLSQTDTLLELTFDKLDLVEAESWAKKYSEFILKPVREKGKVSEIIRYGILFNFGECNHLLEKTPIEAFLDTYPVRAKDLNIRFSERLPVDEGWMRKGVQDYRNVIYTIQQDDAGKATMSVDYQLYFDPPLDHDDWGEKRYDFSDFADRGINFIQIKYNSLFDFFKREPKAA